MHRKPLQAAARIERILFSVRPEIRDTIARLVEASADELVETFYSTLTQDQEAARFLSHKLVDERLHRSLRQWLVDLFAGDAEAGGVQALAERQKGIGEAHARMRISIHLVMQGADLLKSSIFERLQQTGLERDRLWEATVYATGLMDCAIEIMSQSFVRSTASRAQTDEAYRLFSLGQDITVDKESQRAALMEWSLGVLFSLSVQGQAQQVRLTPLSRSDFGLWLRHRAGVMFEGSANLAHIEKSMQTIDEELLPKLEEACSADPSSLPELLEGFQAIVGEMKFLLVDMFQSVAAIESGRDPLTKALNRRFLPSILSREIILATKNKTSFSLLMIDVDHFKQINDAWGHQAGDAVLRQIADAILDACRLSDFVLRYGGEEFLVALVEKDLEAAFRAAEGIRLQVGTREFLAPDNTPLPVTVSIGVATFDGHPDFSRLIEMADRALYTAKRNGRNRTVIAEQTQFRQAG
ncbi:GGDEF domain-containing protein [Microvirga roseola]|uniref:GGDEF domain-containing protein n=1 Tax=Microvirga roseola TaxID=2883126 RepID=UPI001E3D5663|nr:GGDEF domain-containing protein [Microvirga roseola]